MPPEANFKSDQDSLAAFLDGMAFVVPNLNDTFAYACADAEQIEVGDGEIMAAWWCRHGWHGLVALAAWKRGTHPLAELRSPQYLAALRDLSSGREVRCDNEDEGMTWPEWFDLPETSAVALDEQRLGREEDR